MNITWDPITVQTTASIFTYYVIRDGQFLPGCTTQGVECWDQPGSGNHLYRLVSVDERGIASPISAAAEAQEP